MATMGPRPPRKTFVLCFDGTGNKFANAPSDSNILKTFRMLDKSLGAHHYHYYQPGIGTYSDTKNLSHTSRITRFKSWYAKAKDSAIGASVDQHIVAGYKFLMTHYSVGDDIYMFGFSRGAYIARFLAEMIDNVGLLSTGNDEMVYFAWKTSMRWSTRAESTDEQKMEKDALFKFMKGFRETFSRPVRRLRFLGLFDTVNSIPRFETALFERSKFPYSCQTSAKVIRHAVSIDERRVKFRQDLISDATKKNEGAARGPSALRRMSRAPKKKDQVSQLVEKQETQTKAQAQFRPPQQKGLLGEGLMSRRFTRAKSPRYRMPSRRRDESQPPNRDVASFTGVPTDQFDDSESEGEEQDVEEIWFPGCHADIGGGWAPSPGETILLSHTPLVWMVHEAQKAGVHFDTDRLRDLHCIDDQLSDFEWAQRGRAPGNGNGNGNGNGRPNSLNPGPPIPRISIEVDPTDQPAAPSAPPAMARPSAFRSPSYESGAPSPTQGNVGAGARPGVMRSESFEPPQPRMVAPVMEVGPPMSAEKSQFLLRLEASATTGLVHDCLEWNGGLGFAGTAAWKAFELWPFKRMDLQPDGSWRPIRFPLPLGEPRDAPFGAKIHVSAIKRMQANPSYRPGCIIVGGGGRGTKVAPKEMGMGQWRVLRGEGDPVQEVYVRADIEERTRELVRRRTEEELGEMEKGGWRRGADAKERLKNQELGEEPGN